MLVELFDLHLFTEYRPIFIEDVIFAYVTQEIATAKRSLKKDSIYIPIKRQSTKILFMYIQKKWNEKLYTEIQLVRQFH